ncbi:MAG: sulfatase-like hydrolase/transferase, partial [Candidatus Eremiobacterota bacterium]
LVAWAPAARVPWAALAGLGVGLALLALPSLRHRPPPGGSRLPSIAILVFDGLAARHMSLYGYSLDTTPSFAALGRESACFDRAHSNSNGTLTSIPCLMGRYPGSPGTGLAEALRDAGYRTEWVTFLPPDGLNLPGFDRRTTLGYARTRPVFQAVARLAPPTWLQWLSHLMTEEATAFDPYFGLPRDDPYWNREHFPAGLTLDYAADRLAAHPTGLFMLVQVWAPHYPYLPSPDVAGTLGGRPLEDRSFMNRPYEPQDLPRVEALRRRYDEYVVTADRALGRFLRQLEDRGLADRIYLIVTSDHGESFERGVLGHLGPATHEGMIWVPLLMRGPGLPVGRPQTFAEHLDLAPTLLELLGLQPPSGLLGESLLPYIRDPQRRSRKLKVSMSHTVVTGMGGQISIFQDPYKLSFVQQETKIRRLYNLIEDPMEKTDHSEREAELCRKLLETVKISVVIPR